MLRFLRRYFSFFLCALQFNCASLDRNKSEVAESIAPEKSLAQRIPAKKTTQISDYKFKGSSYKVGWITCAADATQGTALLMHRDEAGFDPDKVCDGWMAQVFLSSGFDVIAVNRPGYVNSTGKKDFAGPQSIESTRVAVTAAQRHVKPLNGAWGYSSGAIGAGFFAKTVGNLQWLILGGGIYDLELQTRNTRNKLITDAIQSVLKTEGESAYEHRSLSYDLANIPKRIILYHGKTDTDVEISQAQSFRDVLRSQEFQVTLEELENMGHDLPWMNHYQVLQTLIRSLK